MYCHTEQRRTQRFYIVAIVRHRGTVGAWRNRGDLRGFINVFCLLHYKTFVLQDFLKRFLQSYQQHVHYGSVALLCLRHLRDIVFMLLPPCSPPLCVPFICSRLTLSLQIPEEPKMNRKVFTPLSIFSKKNTFKTKFLSGFINA